MTWPDTKPAPSLTRNEIGCDVAGLADPADRDLVAAACEILERDADPRGGGGVMSVAMKPGAMALTVTPNLPSSIARVLVKPCRPALAAE